MVRVSVGVGTAKALAYPRFLSPQSPLKEQHDSDQCKLAISDDLLGPYLYLNATKNPIQGLVDGVSLLRTRTGSRAIPAPSPPSKDTTLRL